MDMRGFIDVAGDGSILQDPNTGFYYDGETGNLITDPSLSTAPANPSLGNGNSPSNAPAITAILAQYGATLTGILAGRAVSTPQVKVSAAPGNRLTSGTQISASMVLLLAVGGLILFKVFSK